MWSQVIPAATVGEPPPPSDAPLEAGLIKMFGMPPEPSRDSDVLTGIGASPGTVQGRAKVVRRLSEASIQPDSIKQRKDGRTAQLGRPTDCTTQGDQ